MTKIKNYEPDYVITDKDKVIGSDGDNSLITRNYSFKQIKDFVKEGLSPEIGGTLKLTELTYNGNLYSTPQDFVNSLDPIVTVLKYELVIVNINGNKWLFRKYDITIGVTETPTTINDYVSISSSNSTQDLQSVLYNGNESDSSIRLIYPFQNKVLEYQYNNFRYTDENGSNISLWFDTGTFTDGKQFVLPSSKTDGIYTLATLDDIPSTSNFVDLTSQQTITDTKTFDARQHFNNEIILLAPNILNYELQYSNTRLGTINGHFAFSSNGNSPVAISTENLNYLSNVKLIVPNQSGTLALINNATSITAVSFIKSGGTSTQFLMADGSVKESNPQREITSSTTIANSDNGQTIFINNGATPITITINTTITTANFGVGFIQQGTGDVTFVGTGVSLTNPIGLKSKGQGYATYIERKLNTSTYVLLGDTKA